jgi:hypothetical protein
MWRGQGSKLGALLVLASLVTLIPLAAGADPRAATSATYVARRVAAPGRAVGPAGAVEFEVTGNGPFPARALDPVLHVGKVEVRDYRYQGDRSRTLVFTAPDASRLEDGAAVTLSYEPGRHDRIDLPALQLNAIAP